MRHDSNISIDHGAGGSLTHSLVHEFILSELGNEILNKLDDSAVLEEVPQGYKIAYTTDSHVVDPIFFPGGDIGRLAVSGTVNDLAVSGATCKYLSLSLIIEAGLNLDDLKRVIQSIKSTAIESRVKVVTGDTKVVPKGKADKIFINTSGFGFVRNDLNISTWNAEEGDVIIVNGTIGDHEIAILNARENLKLKPNICSDVGPINHEIEQILSQTKKIHCFKDLTRGGLAGALVEIAEHSQHEIFIDESLLPVKDEVLGVCELLGFDIIYLANEGKFVTVCPECEAPKVLSVLGNKAKVIGQVKTKFTKGQLFMETLSGGTRKIHMMISSQLPRIC